MADPISLSFGISSTLQVIASTTIAVYKFVQICREARGDILGVNQELTALKQILEWLNNDTDGSQAALIPESLTTQILPIISRCNLTLDKIVTILERYSGGTGPIRWAIDGKVKISSLQVELASYRDALNLALVTVDIILTRDIKDDTAVIRDDTAILKLGQEEILARVDELKAELMRNIHLSDPIIQRYRSEAVAPLQSPEPLILVEAEVECVTSESTPHSESTEAAGELVIRENETQASTMPLPRQQAEAIVDSFAILSTSVESTTMAIPVERPGSPILSLYDLEISPVISTQRRLSSVSIVEQPEQEDHLDMYSSSLISSDEAYREVSSSSAINTTKPTSVRNSQPSINPHNFVNSRRNLGRSLDPEVASTTMSLSLSSVGGTSIVTSASRIKSNIIHSPSSGDWHLGDTIGVNKNGKVRNVRNKAKGITAVCKIIPRITDEATPKHKIVRIASMSTKILLLDHPFICQHLEVFQTKNNCYLLLENIKGCTLSDYLACHGRLKEQQARKFGRQILSALSYCHQHSIIHANLRPDQLLIRKNGDLALKGFVYNNIFSPKGYFMSSPAQRYYSAPELLRDRSFVGPEVDVWSFGIIQYQMICGTVPFQAESVPQLLATIMKAEVAYKQDVGPSFKQLISHTLGHDPKYRANIQKLAHHPWMLKGYPTAASAHIPLREPLKLPLDNTVISRMLGTTSKSFESIKAQLEQVITSDAYQQSTARSNREKALPPSEPPGDVGPSGIKRIMSLYKKPKMSVEVTELDGFGLAKMGCEGGAVGFAEQGGPVDPLVVLYYLARERCGKEQSGMSGYA